MNTNKITLAKTYLFAYKYLETVCNCIDGTITKLAKRSFYVGGVWNEENTTYKISERMLKLKDKKIDYINLKIIIENVLKNMKKQNAKLLILRSIKELSVQTICSVMDISQRTYFRKLNLALEEFMRGMEKAGYGYEKFSICFYGDNFINSAYKMSDEKEDVLASVKYESGFFERFVLRMCDC